MFPVAAELQASAVKFNKDLPKKQGGVRNCRQGEARQQARPAAPGAVVR